MIWTAYANPSSSIGFEVHAQRWLCGSYGTVPARATFTSVQKHQHELPSVTAQLITASHLGCILRDCKVQRSQRQQGQDSHLECLGQKVLTPAGQVSIF